MTCQGLGSFRLFQCEIAVDFLNKKIYMLKRLGCETGGGGNHASRNVLVWGEKSRKGL